ncbi:unnamed protein product, partial [Dicrocoelium dendriticum]
METSTTVLDIQQPLKYNQTDPSSSDVIPKNYGQDDIKPRPQTMHEDKLLRMQVTNVEVPDPLFTVGDDHGLLALKDAPGFRRYQPRNRDQQKTAITPSISAPVPVLDDTSLSDQTREENTYAIIDNKHNGALVKPLERTSGSRPALEMSMYILLGLFALVGLVFAVNCGAVVARYRWERMGQLRELLRTERFTPSTPEDGCHSDSKPADNNCESNLFNVPNVTTTMREKLSLMKNWKASLFSERRKQK